MNFPSVEPSSTIPDCEIRRPSARCFGIIILFCSVIKFRLNPNHVLLQDSIESPRVISTDVLSQDIKRFPAVIYNR